MHDFPKRRSRGSKIGDKTSKSSNFFHFKLKNTRKRRQTEQNHSTKPRETFRKQNRNVKGTNKRNTRRDVRRVEITDRDENHETQIRSYHEKYFKICHKSHIETISTLRRTFQHRFESNRTTIVENTNEYTNVFE